MPRTSMGARAARLVAVACAAAAPAAARAQADSIGVFKQPTVLFQPGLATVNFLDAPSGTSASTEFNFRVVAAVPTSIPRTTVVGIVQFTPALQANGANFVYGPVFSVFDSRLFALDFDVLGAYGANPRTTGRDYTHKLVLEADLYFKLGRAAKLRGSLGDTRLYGFFGNVTTGLAPGASGWFLLSGLSVPIAPWRKPGR